MSARLLPHPERSAAILPLSFEAGGGVPNNPAYPALLVSNVFADEGDDDGLCALMERNGWGGAWTWEVFPFHHFHPDAFEMLVVASGAATLVIGGPNGKALDVSAGDALLLPPGVGHCQVAKRGGFRICGAYPPVQENYTVVRADDGFNDAMLDQIAAVPFPETDPLWGGNGPLLKALLG